MPSGSREAQTMDDDKNLTSLYIYAAVSIIYIPESRVINTDLELEYSDIIVRSRKFRHFYIVSAGVSVPQCHSSVSRSVEASPLFTQLRSIHYSAQLTSDHLFLELCGQDLVGGRGMLRRKSSRLRIKQKYHLNGT